jgi:hypothetical protein
MSQNSQRVSSPSQNHNGKNQKRLVGFSDKINDESFSNYITKEKNLSLGLAIFTAAIFPIILGLGSLFIDFISNTEALMYGFFLAIVYLIFAFRFYNKTKNTKSWDGKVIGKEQEFKKGKKGNTVESIENYVIIENDTGSIHRIKSNHLYNYLEANDKVRFHGGLNTFEKYDKTNDKIIYCNVCESKNDISRERCYYCNSLLLK